jgi:hypothetical protein
MTVVRRENALDFSPRTRSLYPPAPLRSATAKAGRTANSSYDGHSMKTLTWEQAAEWANSAGLSATVDRAVQEYAADDGQKRSYSTINKHIHFPNEDAALRLTLPLPKLPYQVSYLANALLPYSESDELLPCLLWMTDWGIMGEVSERVAKSLSQCFRSARGETKLLIDTPAHLFNKTEAVDAQTLLTIAIVFGWDCYVIPEHANYYALTSHDEYLDVVSRSPATHERFMSELERWHAREWH